MAMIVQGLGLLATLLFGFVLVRRLLGPNQQEGNDAWLFKTEALLGVRKERFSWARAQFRSLTDLGHLISEGYKKYSAVNMLFAVMSLDKGPIVVMPSQQMKKIYGLPEHKLSATEEQHSIFHSKWTFSHALVWQEPVIRRLVRNQLTHDLPNLAPRVGAEIQFALERCWGKGTEWRQVRVQSSTLRIVAAAATSAFCGLPLCRDVVFQDGLRNHTMAVIGGSMALSCFPAALQPVLGPVLSAVCRLMRQRVMARSRPIVRERLDKTARLESDADFVWERPQDMLQWIIDDARASLDREQLKLQRVCETLLFANFTSLLSTALTAQNLILDLFSSDPACGYVDALREECQTVLGESGGKWTINALNKLRLVDAAIRESMRISPLASLMLQRKVVDPDGLLVDGLSTPLPTGTCIAMPVERMHLDATRYSDPLVYNPFRFVHKSDQGHGNNKDVVTVEKEPLSVKSSVKSTVSLDTDFLGFGFGKHSCPGRFLVLLELKMLVANLLLNYQVEHITSRPKPIHIMWLRLPLDVKIRIRRKEQA